MLTDVDTELTLIYCLASNSEEAEEAASAALALARPNILTAIALESEALRETAAIVAATEEVRTRVGELESDRAARKELAGRREEAEAAFREEWNRLYRPQHNGTRWYYQGEKTQFVNQREFKAFLSQMADNTYYQAPILRNELVNRDQLSSAAAAGRRALIEAMLAHAAEPNLGIRSFPPARSIYECILKATGLHQRVQGDRWRFAAPPEGNPQQLAPGWHALCDAVFVEPLGPHPVSELYSLLAAPPYGLTQGVLP
ncbi:MAG TPA: hypothetical protein VHR86_03360, partial [Armatimonadota bacterium]|nr:hypothetical protein [Armatimonadota bacterium]